LIWSPTGDGGFPYAARLDGQWWVVRVNAFPDHPLYTVLVDGRFYSDFEDWPEGWERGTSPVEAVLPVQLTAYGSERGDPCGCPYC
jgi:hypothetical protein